MVEAELVAGPGCRPDTPREAARTHLACAAVNIELALRMTDLTHAAPRADRLRAALAALHRAADAVDTV